MMWTAAKVALFACWSLVLGYFLAALAEQLAPATVVAPSGFGAAVLGLAAGIFPCLWIAFRKVAPREYNATELPQPPAETGIRCPSCHGTMRLVGSDGTHRRARFYFWTCAAGHAWSRQGENAEDASFPWQALSASRLPGVLFG